MTIGKTMKSTPYSIKAGDFKAKCLQLMDEVNEKHISIIITKHGKPVAKLTPIEAIPVDFFGCLKNIITIQKDIISPIDVTWESNE
jgi:prevent-host-death family protein